MPSGVLSLALAASIYPPALAAVIALGRGVDVRLRVLLLVLAGLLTVFLTGALMLVLFNELGATSKQQRTASAGLYIAAGVVLALVALRLNRPVPNAPKPERGPSKTARYLESRRLVLVLGIVLYVVPSPIYVGAVKSIADAKASTAQELRYLALTAVVMLWMIEVPGVLLVAFPARTTDALANINGWFARHGRRVAVIAAAGAAAYLIAIGVLEVLN